jgi:hypothetical protein
VINGSDEEVHEPFGSDPNRSTCPSGSATFISQAHGKFSGAWRILAPVCRYSLWSASTSSTALRIPRCLASSFV